jgi:small subunit ribosomal protein S10
MKFRIFLKSFNSKEINTASQDLTMLLAETDCKVSGIVALPTRIKKFCVLRSPQNDKDSREHFEVRIYKRFLDITAPSPVILDPILRMDLPPGVASSLKILQY